MPAAAHSGSTIYRDGSGSRLAEKRSFATGRPGCAGTQVPKTATRAVITFADDHTDVTRSAGREQPPKAPRSTLQQRRSQAGHSSPGSSVPPVPPSRSSAWALSLPFPPTIGQFWRPSVLPIPRRGKRATGMIGWLRRMLASAPEAGEWAVAAGDENGVRGRARHARGSEERFAGDHDHRKRAAGMGLVCGRFRCLLRARAGTTGDVGQSFSGRTAFVYCPPVSDRCSHMREYNRCS